MTALFAQVNGDVEVGDNRLRYNVGVRYVKTDQSVTSRLTCPIPRNPCAPSTPADDGSRWRRYRYVATYSIATYENWLPSGNRGLESDRQRDRACRPVHDDDARESDGHAAGAERSATPTCRRSTWAIRNSIPYLSDNIDLGFEYYTGAGGLLRCRRVPQGHRRASRSGRRHRAVRRPRAVRRDAGLAERRPARLR